MLAAHEIDCAIIARPPTCFLEGHPDVARLFPDYVEMEEALLHAHQGLADHAHHRDEAVDRRASIRGRRATSTTPSSSRSAGRSNASSTRRCRAIPCRGSPPTRRRMRDAFGGDLFPYGIEENRPTWDQMALYTVQQGIAHRLMAAEDMFPRGHHDEGRDLIAASSGATQGTFGNGRPPFRNRRTMSLNRSGCSQAIAWPASGIVVHWAPLT